MIGDCKGFCFQAVEDVTEDRDGERAPPPEEEVDDEPTEREKKVRRYRDIDFVSVLINFEPVYPYPVIVICAFQYLSLFYSFSLFSATS